MVSRTLTIAANNDDMYRYDAGGASACLNDDTVAIGGYSGDACHASFRFLQFPGTGREIVLVSAKLYVHCTTAMTPTQTVHIHCDKAVNPTLAIGGGASGCDPNDRTLTTASADWILPTVGAGDHVYSSDLKAVLQEVIDQPTFTAGNAVLVALLGHAGGGDGNGLWVAGLEHATGDPAQLILEYAFIVQGGML